MKKLSLLIALSSIVCSVGAMEVQQSSYVLSTPDITKLVAYAMIATSDYNDGGNPKKLLKDLRSFSSVNKSIHATMYNLRCGSDKEAHNFNEHLMAHMAETFALYKKHSPTMLAAAYVGTPIALQVIENNYSFTTDMDTIKKNLDAQTIRTLKHKEQIIHYEGPPSASFNTKWATIYQEEYYQTELEPLDTTLAKFPPSTRTFFKRLVSGNEQ